MSRNIVFEGWLTKSPPTKRIWRAKWRRRWFALRQSGELPGQYFLDYFADRNCRRLKGTINLDLCEQVDAGLHIERGSDSLEPKLRGTVFTVRTQSRTYHLQADCEADMEKWVSTICQACGLRASDDEPSEVYRPAEPADGTGPYIAISECITGAREQESETAFTFDPNSIMRSTRLPYDRHRMRMQHDQKYASQSENDSNQSEDDSKSLASSEVGEWSVSRTFRKKLAISPRHRIHGVSEDGPPVPPRPPKLMRPIYQGPVVREPGPQIPEIRIEDATVSPRRASFYSEEEDDNACGPQSEYLNLTSLPPAVDRKLKPRRNNHHQYNSHVAGSVPKSLTFPESEEKANKLHYIDLDLPKLSPNRVNSHHSTNSTEKANYIHGKESLDKADYRTVDFIKTEAFNITRMDAEAARSAHI